MDTFTMKASENDQFQILPLAEHPEFRERAMEIYRYSFPDNEYTDIARLPSLLPPEYQFDEWALVYESRAVGYLIIVFTDKIAYPLHLAVAKECRGKGFGTRAMEFINQEYASYLVYFSVETPSETAENQQQRLARIRLYERIGYQLTGINVLDHGTLYTVMCRKTATDKEIATICEHVSMLSELFDATVTVAK